MSRSDREKRRIFDNFKGYPERHGFRRHNYWDEWRKENHHIHRGEFKRSMRSLSAKELEDWREFFHNFFGVWPEDHWIFGGRRFGPWQQGMEAFNPFVATLLSKGGGLLPLYVLHLVSQQPRYGNEIMDILAARTNGQWVSNPGAIYPLLTQLEDEGYIKGEWADPAKRTIRTYSVTTAGQEELERVRGIVGPKIEETISVLDVFLKDLQEPSETPEQ